MTDLEKEKNARLRKELRDVKMERDILKTAVSIFFKSDGKSTNFMSDHRPRFSIEMMCKVFMVSRVSYYR